MIAYEDILYCIHDGMPQVQCSRDIGRWHANDKRWFAGVAVGFKVAAFFPEAIPFALDSLWVIGFRQGRTGLCPSFFVLLDHVHSNLISNHEKALPSSRTRKGVRCSWYHLVSINLAYFKLRLILMWRDNGRSRGTCYFPNSQATFDTFFPGKTSSLLIFPLLRDVYLLLLLIVMLRV